MLEVSMNEDKHINSSSVFLIPVGLGSFSVSDKLKHKKKKKFHQVIRIIKSYNSLSRKQLQRASISNPLPWVGCPAPAEDAQDLIEPGLEQGWGPHSSGLLCQGLTFTLSKERPLNV